MKDRMPKYFLLLAVSIVFMMGVGRLSAVGWLAPTNNPPDNGAIIPIEADGEDGLGSHVATLNLNMSNKQVEGVGVGSGWALQATSTIAARTLKVTASGSGQAIFAQSTAADTPALRIYNPNGLAMLLQSAGGALYVEKNLRVSNGGAGVGGLNWQDSVLWTSPGAAKSKSLYWGKDIVCDNTKADCGRQSVVGAGDNLGNVQVTTDGLKGHTAKYDLDMAGNRVYGIGDVEGTERIGLTPLVSLSAKNTAVAFVDSGAALNTVSDKSYGLAVQSSSQGGNYSTGHLDNVTGGSLYETSVQAVTYHGEIYAGLSVGNSLPATQDILVHRGLDPATGWTPLVSRTDLGCTPKGFNPPIDGSQIYGAAVYNDKLFIGLDNDTVNEEVYIYNANTGSEQCLNNATGMKLDQLFAYKDYLWTLKTNFHSCEFWRSTDGINWTNVLTQDSCRGDNSAVINKYNDKIYIYTDANEKDNLNRDLMALYEFDGTTARRLDYRSPTMPGWFKICGGSENRCGMTIMMNKIYLSDGTDTYTFDLTTETKTLITANYSPRAMTTWQGSVWSIDYVTFSLKRWNGSTWEEPAPTFHSPFSFLLTSSNNVLYSIAIQDVDYLTAGQSFAAYAQNNGNGYGLVGSNVSSPGGLFYGQTMVATDDTALVEPQVTFGADNNRLSVLRATSAPTASIYWGNTKLCDMNQLNDCFGALTGVQLWTKTADNDLWTDSLTSIGGQTKTAKLEVMPKASVLSSATLAGITATKFQVQGDYLYTVRGSGPSFMEVWNIVNPAAPTQVGTALQINASLAVNDFKVAGNYAYFVVGVNGSVDNRLIVSNISNPASPGVATAVFTFPNTEEPTAIEISGSLAMVGTHWRTFALDISKPLTPVELSRKEYEASGNFNSVDDIAISGNYAYVVANAEKLHVYDISNTKSMTVSSYTPSGFSPTKIYVYGNYAFVSNGSTGLQVLNVSNPGAITKVDEIPLADATYGLEVVGHYLFTSGATGLLGVWDISKLGSLSSEPLGNVFVGTTGTNGRGILVRGSKVFALKSDNSVSLVNIGGTNFQTLKVGSLSSDNVYVSTGVSRADSIYAGNGLIGGGNLTVNKGSLISTAGVIKIGATELTKARLDELKAWLTSLGY